MRSMIESKWRREKERKERCNTVLHVRKESPVQDRQEDRVMSEVSRSPKLPITLHSPAHHLAGAAGTRRHSLTKVPGNERQPDKVSYIDDIHAGTMCSRP